MSFKKMLKYKSRKAILIVGVIAVIHVFLLSQLAFFPYPELLIYSYLTENGLIPYSQIFDQHFPGMMFFPINLASLGINTPLEIRILHLATIGLTHLILFLVARKLLKNDGLALIANILYLLWQPFFEGYVFWIDTIMPLLMLPAIYLLLDYKNKKKLFLAGLFLGISLLFKQVAIPILVILTAFLYIKLHSVIKITPFIIGAGIPIIYLIFWVLGLGIWDEFYYWTVTFNLTTFSKLGRKLPSFGELARIGSIYGPTLILAAMKMKKNYANFLLAIFLIGSLFFAYARFDYVHFQPSLVFIVIIVVIVIKKLNMTNKFLFLMYVVIISLILLLPFYKNFRSDRVYFYGEFEERLSKSVREYANRGDSVFAMGTTPHIYQLTNTLPSGKVFVFQFPWFMEVAEQRILEGVRKDPPKVVIRDPNARVQDMNLISHMPEIQKFINANYLITDKIDNVEVLIIKK